MNKIKYSLKNITVDWTMTQRFVELLDRKLYMSSQTAYISCKVGHVIVFGWTSITLTFKKYIIKNTKLLNIKWICIDIQLNVQWFEDMNVLSCCTIDIVWCLNTKQYFLCLRLESQLTRLILMLWRPCLYQISHWLIYL